MEFLEIPQKLVNNLPLGWTFVLLLARYTGVIMLLPGLGAGIQGLTLRLPAIIVLALSSLPSSQLATLPSDIVLMSSSLVSELLFGSILAFIPMMVVAGVQTGAQLASTTMGLGASQLIDPTFGGSSTDLARIFGDLTIVIFLLLGGHHLVIYAASGISGEFVPGTFLLSDQVITLFTDKSAEIFKIGLVISAPVVVALLLTQFVMGLISRAVPTVNIFIISFPLTIGIGLLLSVIALPDIIHFISKEFTGIEEILAGLISV